MHCIDRGIKYTYTVSDKRPEKAYNMSGFNEMIPLKEEQLETWNDRMAFAIATRKASFSELGRITGLSRQAVSTWVATDRPRTKTLTSEAFLKACEYLKVNPHWILFGQGAMDVELDGMTPLEHLNGPPILGITSNYKSKKVINWSQPDDDAFVPRIWPKDVLFVDTEQTKLEDAYIFLFEDTSDGFQFIRRYISNRIAKAYALCDSTTPNDQITWYDRETFDDILKGLKIIGKVIGRYTDHL